MQTDTAIQTIFNVLKNVTWRKCDNNDRFEWYYAESMHYVIHDTLTNGYHFVKAKSPNNAYEVVAKKVFQ